MPSDFRGLGEGADWDPVLIGEYPVYESVIPELGKIMTERGRLDLGNLVRPPGRRSIQLEPGQDGGEPP